MATVDPTKVPNEVKEAAVDAMMVHLNGVTREDARAALDAAGLVIRQHYDSVFGVAR